RSPAQRGLGPAADPPTATVAPARPPGRRRPNAPALPHPHRNGSARAADAGALARPSPGPATAQRQWLRLLAGDVLVPGRAADLVALGVLAVAIAALMAEAILAGQIAVERDTYLFYYPLYQWFANQLQAGHLPLWFPNMFSGYPLYADGETG